ncbi:hypothetical protein [Streptomyces sp. NPDC058279]|uniref:hypothetical protein n=1 Tax=Streptomyces sp. NPDC058279 TaxID=3346418 RepID=UPI0036ECF2D3
MVTPAVALVVDVHRADRGQPSEPDDLVEVDAADAEAYRGLVRAEWHVAVQEGGQVPAAGEGGHLVGWTSGNSTSPPK